MQPPVSRLPYHMLKRGELLWNNKPQAPLLGVERKLQHFYDEHTLGLHGIRLLYNMEAIVVVANHPESWTERYHELLCKEFPIFLHVVEKDEVIYARRVETTMIYQYIPKFLKDKWTELNEVKWNQI